MDQIERIREILYGYETAGLIDGDLERVLSYVTDDIIGIGMGEQGVVTSKKDIRDIMRNTIKKDDEGTYQVEIEEIEIHLTSPASASLCAKVYVKRHSGGRVTTSGFFQSLALVLRDGDWLICALHASPIMLTEECIESYPMTFADNTLAQLRSEVQGEAFQLLSQSLSGGVVGTYIRKGNPICFANDALLALLGYERKAFEQAFRDGFDKVSPPEELQRIRTLQENRTDHNTDFAARTQWIRKDGSRIWVEYRSRRIPGERGEDIYLTVVMDVTELVTLQQETKAQNQMILSSLDYASKIQRDLLPPDRVFRAAFRDYAVLWEPRDMVGGDLYWLRQFQAGTLLCAFDCTGHGTPGALLTMLVASALDSVAFDGNCQNTAQVIWALERRMVEALNVRENASEMMQIRDGCDLALLFVAHDGTVTVSSAGMHVFYCDGVEVTQIKGQRLHIGEGRLTGPEGIRAVTVPANPQNRFYIATDGLFDQIGGPKGLPFGYRTWKELLLTYHGAPQADVIGRIWEAFEAYRGTCARRDDVQMITFRP